MLTNITVEEAWGIFRNVTVPLQPESVSLLDSLHRIAAFDLVSASDLPACYQSAVDGFVIHKSDLQGERELCVMEGVIGPGKLPASSLNPGNTQKIATGGTLPSGSAAVIPEEEAIFKGDCLYVKKETAAGANVRPQGEDFKRGEIILRRNVRLTPGVLGVLAAIGEERIMVVPRPSVAIICLGQEIIPHNNIPGSEQVRDSNGPLLASLIIQDGGDVACLEYKSKASTRKNFLSTLEDVFEQADLVITIGGTAFGEPDDQAIPLLREAGITMLFWGIQVKPGSHSGGGLWEYKPVIALSGNPSACAVGYHLLVSPVLRQMQGLPFAPEKTMAVCVDKYSSNGSKRRFLRGQMFIEEGLWKVKILPGQKSSMLKSLLSYNSLIDLEAGQPQVEKDSMVPVIKVI